MYVFYKFRKVKNDYLLAKIIFSHNILDHKGFCEKEDLSEFDH